MEAFLRWGSPETDSEAESCRQKVYWGSVLGDGCTHKNLGKVGLGKAEAEPQKPQLFLGKLWSWDGPSEMS